MKAIVTIDGKKIAVQDVPIPKPRSGQILVKVFAVAQNPTDGKSYLKGETRY
jgi:NADPH:quinone reductase-like Zn-dependent oxidoreductase